MRASSRDTGKEQITQLTILLSIIAVIQVKSEILIRDPASLRSADDEILSNTPHTGMYRIEQYGGLMRAER